MPSNISQLDKLNGMVELFMKDNGKLDYGEVDALAAFYDGLDSYSQQGVKPRLIEIYQKSEYSPGQKEKFSRLLEGSGFTRKDLGEKDLSTAEFLAFPSEKQFAYLKGAKSEQINEIKPKDVAKAARARINNELKSQQQQLKQANPKIAYQFGEQNWNAVHLPKKLDGSMGGIVGYIVHWVITADEYAGVDEDYYFNLNGKYLDHIYRGE